MAEHVRREARGRVGVITVDNPPVNALSLAVRTAVRDQLRAAVADPAIDAIVICAAGRTFMAGADIREFNARPVEPTIGDVAGEIEAAPKPVVAALHGTALGGGYEIALGCHYRIATPTAKIGLPEVNLGLIPGAGGTQRAPHLIGVKVAIAAISSGRHISATEALAMGAIDEIASGDLLEAAIDTAQRLVGTTLRRTLDLPIDVSALPPDFFATERVAVAKRYRGFDAQPAVVDAVEVAVKAPSAQGIAREREISWDLKQGAQSKSLRYLFFGEREVAHIPGIGRETPLRPIASVGVVGAGTMGTGIAVNFLNAGLPVTLIVAKPEALARGRDTIGKIYARDVTKGRLSPDVEAERMGRLTTSLDMAALANVDLVIEAAFEKMSLKQEIFRSLDAVCKPGAILASNTSTLDLDQIAAVTRRPADVIGTHFFSPAHVMKLLEVVRGDKTANDVIATLMNVAKRINKIAVLSGVCFGFIGNRMFEGYVRESQRLLLEGCTPAQVDKALVDWGMAMGPCALVDLAGIDVSYLTREGNRANLPADPSYCLIGDRLHQLGRMGQKAGKGFYRHGPDGAASDPEVETLIRDEAKRLGIAPRVIGDDEIVARCLLPLISEGAQILSEGIALRPVDIDVVWCAGYGFPRYRGGPMFYGDTVGLTQIVDDMAKYARQCGNDFGYWTPSPLLRELAAAGKGFKDWTGA